MSRPTRHTTVPNLADRDGQAHPPAILLLGPTASGKSALAMEIARALPVEIISADSPNFVDDSSIGVTRNSEAWEAGFKDTVIAYPGEITRVKALFDIAGLYVWHCHIVEHEDNEMMRPYRIGPEQPGQPGSMPMP